MSYEYALPHVHVDGFDNSKIAVTFQIGSHTFEEVSFDRDGWENLANKYEVNEDRFDPENLRALTIIYYESEDGTNQHSKVLRIPPKHLAEFERLVREVEFESIVK